MIRVLLAPLLALSLSGCVAAMAAGAATSVVGAAARGSAQAQQPEAAPPPLFHGYGENPRWAVTIFPETMVFYSGDISITQPTPPSITTTEGHLYESERLIVAISHQNCRHTPRSREFPELVRATVDGREFVGCGTEARHAGEAEAEGG